MTSSCHPTAPQWSFRILADREYSIYEEDTENRTDKEQIFYLVISPDGSSVVIQNPGRNK